MKTKTIHKYRNTNE